MDAAAVARLEAYFAQIGANLRDKRKRESFAMYAFGLLGDDERKSAEPIAARVRRRHDEGQWHPPQNAPLRRPVHLG